jgi:hypothetical protein
VRLGEVRRNRSSKLPLCRGNLSHRRAPTCRSTRDESFEVSTMLPCKGNTPLLVVSRHAGRWLQIGYTTRRHIRLIQTLAYPSRRISASVNAVLYTVHVRLLQDGKSIDEDTRRIGFREAKFTDHGFSLKWNNRQIAWPRSPSNLPVRGAGDSGPRATQRRQCIFRCGFRPRGQKCTDTDCRWRNVGFV